MPDIAQQRARAEAFRNMHRGRLLLLPNAWDVASARIFEDGGFAAIATTSAGIAFTLGYPDGERVSRQEMLTAVEDRKSTRLNSSHRCISYAVFCLKKKT